MILLDDLGVCISVLRIAGNQNIENALHTMKL
jgi:hypothetical protein